MFIIDCGKLLLTQGRNKVPGLSHSPNFSRPLFTMEAPVRSPGRPCENFDRQTCSRRGLSPSTFASACHLEFVWTKSDCDKPFSEHFGFPLPIIVPPVIRIFIHSYS